MRLYTRRDLLLMGGALAAGLGLPRRSALTFAAGLERISRQHPRVLWLQAMSCTGCSVSLLNADAPDPLQILTEYISLVFHSNLSAAQGGLAVKTVEQVIQAGDYILVVEGSIPLGMPEACTFGSRPMADVLVDGIKNAKYVVSAGTCSSFGGLPAAEGNPTQAASVQKLMLEAKLPIENRLVNVPGCPLHPHSLVATLALLAAGEYPEVNKLLTPTLFFGSSVHDECPRFHMWQKQEFAEKFGDHGCLFKLGCLGPLSHSDCPRRQWNGGVNWCIRAGSPCVACTSPDFGRTRSFPFYRQCEKNRSVSYNEASRGGESK